MSDVAHWREADQLPRCQHCRSLADERSFMCEDHAFRADTEVQTLRDHLADAVKRIADLEAELHRAHRMIGVYASHASVEILDAVMADMARD